MSTFFRNAVFAAAISIVLTFIAYAVTHWTVHGHGPADRIPKAQSEMRAIHAAIGLFHDECGRWPDTLSELMENDAGRRFLSGYGRMPGDPWGGEYLYVWIDREQGDYRIMSYGPDRHAGGSGIDADISYPPS